MYAKWIMTHCFNKIVTKFLGISILLVSVILVIVLGSNPVLGVQTDPAVKNISSLLQTLAERVRNDPSFEVVFRFHTPILNVDDEWWYVPNLSENPETARGILEIGEHYICFEEGSGSVQLVRCTPFSNIAAINYANLP